MDGANWASIEDKGAIESSDRYRAFSYYDEHSTSDTARVTFTGDANFTGTSLVIRKSMSFVAWGIYASFRLIGKTSAYQTKFYPDTELKNFQYRWTPQKQSSLFAWYDASDNSTLTINSGIVEAIADKSLNNNSLLAGSSSVKNQTLIPGGQNSLDVVSMDGDDHYVTQNMNLPSSGNLSCFMVCKIDAIDSPLDSILSAVGPTSFQFAAGNISEFRGQLAANGIGDSNTGVSTHGNLGGVYRIFALTMDFTSSQQCLIYADGADITNTPIAYTTKLGSPKTFRVFANRANAEKPSGFISEVVFAENTDEATRQKMEGYLAHKWGTSDNLPVSHPYKYQPRYFI